MSSYWSHNKENEFNRKVKSTIKEIVGITSSSGLPHGFHKEKNKTLFGKVGMALVHKGFITNNGTSTTPLYIWNGAKVTETLCNEVRDFIRTKKPSKKPLVPVAIEKVPAVKPALVLVNFTDQELWDELKNRGYAITENRLSKSMYLN